MSVCAQNVMLDIALLKVSDFFLNFTHSFIPVPNLDFEHVFDVEMGL